MFLRINGIEEKTSKKLEYKDGFFAFGITILSIFYFVFYQRIIIGISGEDFELHTKLADIIFSGNFTDYNGDAPVAAVAYPIYHILQKLISILFIIDLNLAANIVVTIVIIVAVLMNRFILNNIGKPKSTYQRYIVDFLSLGSVVFMTARSPLNEWRFYMEQAAANPIHNPTILVVRPIGFLCVFIFASIMTKHNEKYNNMNKTVVLFSFLCFFSTIAKPSFTIVFLPAMGVVVLLSMLRNRNIFFGLKLLLSVLPTLFTVIFQQIWVMKSSGLLQTTINWGGYANLNTWQVVAASLSTFPVVILGFSLKRFWESPIYQVSILALIIGWFQMFFLTEGLAGNYTWGYALAVQFSTLITLAFLIRQENKNLKHRILCCISLILYAYQIFVGLIYMSSIYDGVHFYI